jgi:hypothetical protein
VRDSRPEAIMSVLVSCTSCARHVRADETACPFCSAPVVPRPPAVLDHRPYARLSRAALALASVAAVSACEKSPSPPAPAYGGPPIVTTETAAAPAYGAPPPMVTADAAPPATPVTSPPNIPAPAYGAPPPRKP